MIIQVLNKNIPISGPIIKEKAREFGSNLSIDNLSASNGRLEGFKKKNDIIFKNVCGKRNAVNNDCNQWIKNLPALLHDFRPITYSMLMKRTYSTSTSLSNITFTLKG